MYKKSISENSKYLLPFICGIKMYNNDEIISSVGTMMIINDKGDILTCKHIAEQFITNDKLNSNYENLLKKIKTAKTKKEKSDIEKELKLTESTAVLSHIYFPIENKENLKIKILFHKYLDLALIRIPNLNIKCKQYPVFSKELPLQGQSVCKLGYAFSEVNIFEYKDNKIVIKDNNSLNLPLFPMDGIVTRHTLVKGKISMFETSTPGLRGQSGGPVFSPEGIVYGMQAMTEHMDLNFDIHGKVKRGCFEKEVNYTPFINLGVSISSKEIIDFLNENNVEYKSN